MCKKVHSRLYRLLLESVEFETLAPASENIAESKPAWLKANTLGHKKIILSIRLE